MIHLLQFIDKVVDVLVCRFSSSLGAVYEKAVEIPQLQQVEAWTLGRALCTERLTPAIRAEKGWRGCRESDSQVTCHPNSLQAAVWHGQTRHTSTTSAPPPPPKTPTTTTTTTTTTTRRLSSNLRCHCCVTFCDDGLQRAAHGWRCEAKKGATAADALASRATVAPYGSGCSDAPQRAAQGKGGSGGRDERRATSTEASTPGEAAKLGQHSGIGYELVLALDVPVLQMVEQPVDASALAFFEEEAKALHAEYLVLARGAGPCCLLPRRAAAGGHSADARAPREGSGEEEEEEEEEASSSLSSSSTGVWVLLAEYTVPASTHCFVLQWILPRSRRLFGTNSTQLLRDGGALAVRTWKPGLSKSHFYLAPTCPVPVTPLEHRKIWCFPETSSRFFYDLLYLTVTCSEFARGVQDYGFFWKVPSGRIPYSILLVSTVDACLRLFTEAGPDCKKLRILRSCSSFLIVDIPFVPQWQISMVQTLLSPWSFPSCSLFG